LNTVGEKAKMILNEGKRIHNISIEFKY